MTPNHYPGSWGGEHSVQFALPLMVEAVTEAPSGSLACRIEHFRVLQFEFGSTVRAVAFQCGSGGRLSLRSSGIQ